MLKYKWKSTHITHMEVVDSIVNSSKGKELLCELGFMKKEEVLPISIGDVFFYNGFTLLLTQTGYAPAKISLLVIQKYLGSFAQHRSGSSVLVEDTHNITEKELLKAFGVNSVKFEDIMVTRIPAAEVSINVKRV
jgi:hypothetical protein